MTNLRKMLVVTQQQSPFEEFSTEFGLELTFCNNILDGIAFASQVSYDLILIQMSQVLGRIDHALESLRHSGSDAKIILLCSLTQEPLARQLVRERTNNIPLADDYIIYPLGFQEQFKKLLCSAKPHSDSSPDAKLLEQLEQLATEDDLTHLKNRRYIRQFLQQILEYARTDNFHVTLLLFDIDNFKHYNDQYGHAVGDEVLYQVGQIMKRCCRSHDVVARVGGDEFAVVFWDLPAEVHDKDISPERRKLLSEHPRETVFMSERFRRQLSKAKLSSLGASGKGHLTISGGLASFPKDGWDMKQLFEQADQAMLQAKRSGKNRIHIVGKSEDSTHSSNQIPHSNDVSE
ncbi:MAG: diguanylate cyclase [Anaerohalosphaeraceae bacterium]